MTSATAERNDSAASNAAKRLKMKDWITVLGLTLKMVHSVPYAGLVRAKDVEKVRSVAAKF